MNAKGTTMTVRHRRGFTLVELMVAVAILAVLASLAVIAFGRQVKRARLNDMRSMVMQVAAKQEQYFGLTGQYAGPSTGTPVCPSAIRASAVPFAIGSCDSTWAELSITPPRGTYFQYSILAGGPGAGDDCTRPSETDLSQNEVCGRIDNDTHWWVVIARGDQDGDGLTSEFVTDSTMNGLFYSERELE